MLQPATACSGFRCAVRRGVEGAVRQTAPQCPPPPAAPCYSLLQPAQVSGARCGGVWRVLLGGQPHSAHLHRLPHATACSGFRCAVRRGVEGTVRQTASQRPPPPAAPCYSLLQPPLSRTWTPPHPPPSADPCYSLLQLPATASLPLSRTWTPSPHPPPSTAAR